MTIVASHEGTKSWLSWPSWEYSLAEIRKFLETWYFYVSDAGHLYARPLKPTLTARQVKAFLRRLEVLGRNRLPLVMVFDFSKGVHSLRRWRQLAEVFSEYARLIEYTSMIIDGNDVGSGIVIIIRSLRKETDPT